MSKVPSRQITSSIDVLRAILVRLNGVVPTGENHQPLFKCWAQILGGEGRDEADIFEALHDISELISKTESQIRTSVELDTDTKQAGYNALTEAKRLVTFDALRASAFNFKSSLSSDATGRLGLLAGALRSEFPLLKLTAEDKDGIKAKLTEMLELLGSERFPIELRSLAERNIKSIIWWLDHNEIIEPQQLLLKSGSLTIVGHQLEAVQPVNSEAGTKFKDSARGIVKTLGRIVGFAVKNEEALERLGSFTHDLIENGSELL